jgi:hypothetical protein
MSQGQTFHGVDGVERTASSEISARAAGELDEDPADSMPGHVKFVGRAGLLFQTYCIIFALMRIHANDYRVVAIVFRGRFAMEWVAVSRGNAQYG